MKFDIAICLRKTIQKIKISVKYKKTITLHEDPKYIFDHISVGFSENKKFFLYIPGEIKNI